MRLQKKMKKVRKSTSLFWCVYTKQFTHSEASPAPAAQASRCASPVLRHLRHFPKVFALPLEAIPNESENIWHPP
jgi:hypothetical protein